MVHRIHAAMKLEPLAGMLRGTVVADETFIGGKPKNRHAADRRNGKRGQTDKTPVLSLVNKETGEVRSQIVPNVSGATLAKAIQEHVDRSAAVLHTDSWSGYVAVGQTMAGHQSVNHNEGEYVRDEVSTNMAEGYFSQLMRSVDVTHHNVSVEHLPRYPRSSTPGTPRGTWTTPSG